MAPEKKAEKAEKAEKKAANKPVKQAEKKPVVFKEAFYRVITRPVITEKATAALEHNKVIFRVPSDATKAQVKEAVEGLFKVEVLRVNTLNSAGKTKFFKGRPGKRSEHKKAIVTLAKGQSIDLAGGVA